MGSANDYPEYTVHSPLQPLQEMNESLQRPGSVRLSGQSQILEQPLAATEQEKKKLGISTGLDVLGIAEVPVWEFDDDDGKHQGMVTFYILQNRSKDASRNVMIMEAGSYRRAMQINTETTANEPILIRSVEPGQELVIGRGEPKYDKNPNFTTGFRKLFRDIKVDDRLDSREHFTLSVREDGVAVIQDHSTNGTVLWAAEQKDTAEAAPAPARPTINGQETPKEWWRFINGEWRLTRIGLHEVPLTEHETSLKGELQQSEFGRVINKHMLFDPAGRPRVYGTALTAGEHPAKVGSLFIVGAAYSASSKPENHINVNMYEQFRDGMLKLGRGMAVFGECIASPNYSPADVRALISRAVWRHPDVTAIQKLIKDPEVVDYVQDHLFSFGISKYHDIGGDKTTYGASDKQIEEGGRKEWTTDDALEEWLQSEQNYPAKVSTEGRKVLLAVMQSFETLSGNDAAWTGSNKDVVKHNDNLARNLRRNFSGRESMPAEVAQALADDLSADAMRAKGIHMPAILGIKEAVKERTRMLAQARSGIALVNPWQSYLRASI